MNDDEIVRWSSAHHEAGHCIVGLQRGLQPNEVALKVRPRWFRRPEVDGYADIDDKGADVSSLALVSAGGPAAEAWWNHVARGSDFAFCHSWTQANNPDDMAKLASYAAASQHREQVIVARAVELVVANWPAVEALAAALVKRGRLSGREIRRLAGVRI
jgi:hypothetical protein